MELIASCLPLFGAKFTGSRSNRNRHCFVRQLSERNSRRREILRRRFDYESRINRASKKFQFCIYTNFSNFLFTYFSLFFSFFGFKCFVNHFILIGVAEFLCWRRFIKDSQGLLYTGIGLGSRGRQWCEKRKRDARAHRHDASILCVDRAEWTDAAKRMRLTSLVSCFLRRWNVRSYTQATFARGLWKYRAFFTDRPHQPLLYNAERR